jgi:hypothetical protein
MPYFGTNPVGTSSANVSASTTVGDGTAEDTKLVFDGNALDFRIGIDDGTDKLEIGKGNAHGTTTHMTIDTNGIVTTPLQSGVFARLSANQSINNATLTKIAYDEEGYDILNEFASNKFTATAAGIYNVTSMLAMALGDGDRLFSGLYKNGSLIHRTQVLAGAAESAKSHLTANVQLSASDYLEVFAQHDYGTARNMTGGNDGAYTYFFINKIA